MREEVIRHTERGRAPPWTRQGLTENGRSSPDPPGPLNFLQSILQVDTRPCPDRCVELRTFDAGGRPGPRKWQPCTPDGIMGLLAQALPLDTHNVYFGAQPRLREGGATADVAEYRCVFADLDCGNGKAHPDKQAAVARLHDCVTAGEVPAPTWVVDSGNGIHVYWTLTEPIPRTPAGDAEYKAIMAGLCDLLAGDPAVFDPPRIMRLPGTHNVKDPRHPLPVRIIEHNEVACSPATLPHAEHEGDGDSSHEPVELPRDLSGWCEKIVTGLRSLYGVAVKVKRTREGTIKALVLPGWCPYCMADEAGRNRPGAGKGKVHLGPVSLTMKCKHESCPASESEAHGGVPVDRWIREHFPKLADLLPRRTPTRDPRAGGTLAEGQDELRGVLADLPNEFEEGTGRMIRVVDCTVGAGKTHQYLQDAVPRANNGIPQIMYAPTHELAEELVERARAVYEALPDRSPEFKIVHAKGRPQVCERKGDLSRVEVEAAHLYAGQTWRRCRTCPHKPECDREMGFDRVGEPYTLTVTVHALAPYLHKKMPEGSIAVFDELPRPLEAAPSFPALDLQAIVADGAYRPWKPNDAIRDDYLAWYDARQEAARAILRLLDDWRKGRKVKKWQDYGLPSDLLKRRTPELLKALGYDRTQGLHPSLDPDDDPEPGKHARFDFDKLCDGLLALLSCKNGGKADLDAGVPFPYLDPDGTPGLARVRRSPLIPRDCNVLILSGGASMVESLIRIAWHDRDVRIAKVEVAESWHVRRVLIQTQTFDQRRKEDPPKRKAAALLNVLLHALPEFDAVGVKPKRDRVRLGTICPKWLSEDLEARPSEFDEAIELLDEVAPRWDTNVLHHGAVEGRDCFHNVDVLLILGDAIPNVGERRAWAEALVLAGATDAPDGDELNAMLTDYAGNQAEGRARGIRRNGDTPCTIIRAGRRLAGAQTVIPLDKRRLPSPVALAAELAAGALFRKHGGCTAEMVLAAITAERDKAPRDGLAGYLFRSWDSRARARRVCVDPRSKQTPQAAPAQRDKVHAGMAAAALRWGAVRLDLPNRAGVGRPVLAWVLPERKDDFMEWWQSRSPSRRPRVRPFAAAMTAWR